MDINNLKSCISHDEATIRSFMRDPKYADYYLQTVIADGDTQEISEVQAWYDEAKTRTAKLGYWGSVVDNAEKTVEAGENSEIIISLVSKALGILQAAGHASA